MGHVVHTWPEWNHLGKTGTRWGEAHVGMAGDAYWRRRSRPLSSHWEDPTHHHCAHTVRTPCTFNWCHFGHRRRRNYGRHHNARSLREPLCCAVFRTSAIYGARNPVRPWAGWRPRYHLSLIYFFSTSTTYTVYCYFPPIFSFRSCNSLFSSSWDGLPCGSLACHPFVITLLQSLPSHTLLHEKSCWL